MSWEEAMKLAIESAGLFKRRYRVFAMRHVFDSHFIYAVRRADS